MSRKLTSFIGIDPGKSGAACLLVIGDDVPDLLFIDWPKTDSVLTVCDELAEWFHCYHIIGAAVESVGPMPKEGVKSVFSFGKNVGRWQGLLAQYKIPTFEPTPQQWRKGLVKKKDGHDKKTANYNVAVGLYPHIHKAFFGPKGGLKTGRVDSTLIATWAFRNLA